MNDSNEENAIRETINFYTEGTRTGNVETLKQCFHELAILCGYHDDELIAAPIQGYYDWVAENPAPAETSDHFDCEVLEIEITNRAATAKVRETSHGEAVIDYFHLLKVGDRWLIVSKLWDAETENN